ncbi:molybdopterin-containing oxidoreductase family protein [Tepidibacillus fermentans]|uniref:Thiosulfate reductase/polysulfide reductase chain A n=1 Tax=Tepidibacillus fermentans TaxID=1281767 RepID=A0A4R3KDL0_9BACI|nr:molybdopterin-dependent oxidoreductase [Tepidibacillus fermentans]TCS81277.1 thiosulfate reductase/polysulfide reductase chain A [Tepidibacillus fermentans]
MGEERRISRRKFLKVSAATGALLTVQPKIGMNQWVNAAKQEDIKRIPTLCNGCTSRCGIIATIKNGRLIHIEGNKEHPTNNGRLCGRAYGAAMLAYHKDRLQGPMKRVGDEFVPISWEQAYKEIGAKLKEIITKYGPASVMYMHNPKEVGKFYGYRFMNAIGSNSIQTHHSVCYISRDVGLEHTIGATPNTDAANAKYMLFIGRSVGDGIKPSHLQGMMKGRDKKAKIVCVDPRHNATANIVDEWIPIKPGTDIALLLAIANTMIKNDWYDKAFIDQYAIGFEEFKKEIQTYTPEWAEKITTIPATKIVEIAKDLSAAKPHAFIDPSWKGAFGCNYLNSPETARMVGLVNAMLGNINQKGGIYFAVEPKLGKLDSAKHPAPEKPKVDHIDGSGVEGQYPLVPSSKGMPHRTPGLIDEGKVKAVFINHFNPVRNTPDRQYNIDGYKKAELIVVCDIWMSETAELAHYVLPEPTYLERTEIIEPLAGKTGAVTIRQQVIDKFHPNTKPFSEIITGIAKEMGLGQYFNFTIDELNEALLKPTGISYKELKEKGVIKTKEMVEFGKVPKLKTESGKVEFYSEAYKKAGFSPIPVWMPPKVEPKKGEFRLIWGKQNVHSHSSTANIPQLMQVTKDYNLERVWINTKKAKELGIKDGDFVIIENDLFKGKIRAKVTERIFPDAIFLPGGYGAFAKNLKISNGFGLCPNDFVKTGTDPISGNGLMMETAVTVRKDV